MGRKINLRARVFTCTNVRSLKYAKTACSFHSSIQVKADHSLFDHKVSVADAAMVGLVAKSMSDANHANFVRNMQQTLRSTQLMESIEDGNVPAVANILDTQVMTINKISAASVYNETFMDVLQKQIDSKSWWNQLSYNQKKYNKKRADHYGIKILLFNKLKQLENNCKKVEEIREIISLKNELRDLLKEVKEACNDDEAKKI